MNNIEFIIASFEGADMAQAHVSEKDASELESYFEAVYMTLPSDAPMSLVLDTFLPLLHQGELEQHLRFYGVTDCIEALNEAGRLKALGNQWVFKK